jgi:hypothetical protein
MNEFSNSSIQQRALVSPTQSLKWLQVSRKRGDFVDELSQRLQEYHLCQVDFLNAAVGRFLDYSRRARTTYRRELLVQTNKSRKIDVDIRLI